ncbi:hypothetical protein K1719_019896 [Acacia pycnantha]|nr:hypothetical protein K1719_019896 [Acacia pycnantha]
METLHRNPSGRDEGHSSSASCVATGIIFSIVYGQMSNYYLLQGETMDTHLGLSFEIPPASLSLFGILSVLFWYPVYFLLIVPIASKITGNTRGLTQLQPMGVGLFISIFFVFFAEVLELVRLRIIQKHNFYGKADIIPISVFWQLPQYFIIGGAEVFMFIGQLEFFCVEAPDARMKNDIIEESKGKGFDTICHQVERYDIEIITSV